MTDSRFLPVHNLSNAPEDSPANELSQSIDDVVPDPVKMADIRPQVLDVLSTVFDPEIPVNIWELGLIYEIEVDASGLALITMTLTSPGCPAAQSLPVEVSNKVKAVPGVSDAKVDIVWEPTWSKDRMSEAAKLQLGMW